MRKRSQFTPARGLYAALATPRQQNCIEADAAAIFDYIDTIVCAGVDGVVLFGSTGEFVHFDVAERIRVFMLARKRCRVPLLVNVSHSSLAGALELAEDAIEGEADGVLLMPPYYFRYSEGQIFEFYRRFAAAVDQRMPIYLYNIPQFTNPMSTALLEKLLLTGEFAGIKDSSGDWPRFEALQALHAKQPFQLLIGSDGLYARAKPLGADGIVSGVAAALPEMMAALQRALEANDVERVELFDSSLHQFLDWLNKMPATMAIKVAAVARGWKLDHSAVPLDERTAAEKHSFERWFRDWLPAVLALSAPADAMRL